MSWFRSPVRFLSWFDTPRKCHVAGATTCAALTIATVLLAITEVKSAAELVVGAQSIKCDDLQTLIKDADTWRARYAALDEQQQSIDESVSELERWLRPVVDWELEKHRLSLLAVKHQIRFQSLSQGSKHQGSRIGVVEAKGIVTGSYENLCRFLHEISDGDNAVACSGVSMRKITDSDDEVLYSSQLKLRIPFTTADSDAAELMSEQINRSPSQT